MPEQQYELYVMEGITGLARAWNSVWHFGSARSHWLAAILPFINFFDFFRDSCFLHLANMATAALLGLCVIFFRVAVCSPVFWADGNGQYFLDTDPGYNYAYDVPNPPSGQGISLTTGSGAFVQSTDSDPFMGIPSMGGPMDLDPADYPSGPPPSTMGQNGQQFPQGRMMGISIQTNPFPLQGSQDGQNGQTAFDLENLNEKRGHIFVPPPVLNNQASGTVINTGSAAQGSLAATGNSKTQTGRFGSQSLGTGQIRGGGLGVSGTQVNSGSAGTGSFLPGGFPIGGTSSNTFLNTLSAAKGKISGDSNTISRTGPGGSSMGESGGNAFGKGQGVQLSQVANSDSQGSNNLGGRWRA